MSGPETGLRQVLTRLLSDARKRLVETGTRNRLVHCARGQKRGKYLDIVDERSDDVFCILQIEGRAMRFLKDPNADKEEEDDAGLPLLSFNSTASENEDRYTDLFLQTTLSDDKLQRKLLSLHRDAKTLEEEQGINALYLALGFLKWFEDKSSEKPRMAPLILLPVALKRDNRRSTFVLQSRQEDLATNEPLKLRLKDNFGISLPELPEEENWEPRSYFAKVREAISAQTRWEVDDDGIQVGFFSFAKLMMVKDLDPSNWSGESILDHPIIASLLAGGFEAEAPLFPPEANLDDILKPSDIIQVLDADASQTRVIETVRAGRNLVVHGPPGTGKSQTITNIIASAVHDGKRVLFVAEKMAALNVVYQRLKNTGIDVAALELHSRQANKKLVSTELDRTLRAGRAVSVGADTAASLQRVRDTLNSLDRRLHDEIGSSGLTAYRVLSTLAALREKGFEPSRISMPDFASWTRQTADEASGVIGSFAELIGKTGLLKDHPLRGIRQKTLLPADQQRLTQDLTALIEQLQGLANRGETLRPVLGFQGELTLEQLGALARVMQYAGQSKPELAPYVAQLVGAGNEKQARGLLAELSSLAETIKKHLPRFKRPAWTMDVQPLREQIAKGASLLGRMSGSYKSARLQFKGMVERPFPDDAAGQLALLDELHELQSAIHDFGSRKDQGQHLLGTHWDNHRSDFQGFLAALDWIEGLQAISRNCQPVLVAALPTQYAPASLQKAGMDIVAESSAVTAELDRVIKLLDFDLQGQLGATSSGQPTIQVLISVLNSWLTNHHRLDEWGRIRTAYEKLQLAGLQPVADAVGAGELEPGRAADTVRQSFAEFLYRTFASQHPDLVNLTGEERDRLVEMFGRLERERFVETAKTVRAKHLNAMPGGGQGEMAVIRGEIAKQRRHLPIRKLVHNAGAALQQIKPVMLMSPISVAQYLPPQRIEFDLLVIDEASQVRPEDALGAIARAKQIVVVGDAKQLPPTNFFDRLQSDDNSADEPDEESEIPVPAGATVTELESILTLCQARAMPEELLNWHYRSRHPSLIEVSNDSFYESKLILPPAPWADRSEYGLFFNPVSGAYDRGGKRHNLIEAQTIVDALAGHARKFADQSLGVVTFSTAQRDIISELLEARRREDRVLDVFLREGLREEAFVKNLENVQGDERDVIMISVGYGPRVARSPLDSMAFGPVSTDGGERRLNVLFTRARLRTEVFCSFDPSDINLDRTKSAGARILKRYLEFAKNGRLQQAQPTGEDPDSEFEVSVANVIRGLGYKVDYQVASTGFKLDMAVHHPSDPGRYMLAVECDGAPYHSSLWARERDRLRQQVLEGLGWNFHRIWSTDWYHRRNEAIERLTSALLSAQDKTMSLGKGANAGTTIITDPDDDGGDDDGERIEENEGGDGLNLAEGDTGSEANAPVLPPYVQADFANWHKCEPHELSVVQMAYFVQKIIDAEGPVHQAEVGRRVAALFDRQRAGGRILGLVLKGLQHLKRKEPNYMEQKGFWASKAQMDDPPLRNRSNASPTLRRADMIPPVEIAAAVRRVIEDNGAIAQDDVPRAIALLFGFLRTGPEFRPAVEPVVKSMIQAGELVDGPGGLMRGEKS